MQEGSADGALPRLQRRVEALTVALTIADADWNRNIAFLWTEVVQDPRRAAPILNVHILRTGDSRARKLGDRRAQLQAKGHKWREDFMSGPADMRSDAEMIFFAWPHSRLSLRRLPGLPPDWVCAHGPIDPLSLSNHQRLAGAALLQVQGIPARPSEHA